jgi:hypothetical protein
MRAAVCRPDASTVSFMTNPDSLAVHSGRGICDIVIDVFDAWPSGSGAPIAVLSSDSTTTEGTVCPPAM